MYSISVYITSFNKGKYLSQAITSVLNQSLYPEEIIIVDDGSSDDSREIISSFMNRYPELITAIYNKQNVGISKSRNIALKECRGDIVTFLDGDDIFYSNKLLFEYEKLTGKPVHNTADEKLSTSLTFTCLLFLKAPLPTIP